MAIHQLVTECVECFLDNEKGLLTGEFDQSLTDEIPSSPILRRIIDLSVEKIYRARQVVEREAAGFEIIEKLMQAFCEAMYDKHHGSKFQNPRLRAIYRLLPTDYDHLMNSENSIYTNLQLIVDFISGLTDKAAVNLYKTISGFTLPS